MHKKAANLSFKFVFVFCLVMFIWLAGWSQTAFSVRGHVVYSFWLADRLVEHYTNTFELTVDGCNAFVRTPGLKATVGEQVANYEWTLTPTSSWFVTIFEDLPTGYRTKTGRRIGRDSSNKQQVVMEYNAFADIFTNASAPIHLGLITPTWLAYASSCVLKGGTNRIAPIAFMGPGWPHVGGENLISLAAISAAIPHLPERITQFGNEAVYEFLNRIQREYLSQGDFPQIYRGGFTNAVYETLSWTNVGNLSLPDRYRVIRFVPKVGGGDSSEVERLLIYEGFADSFSTEVANKIIVPPRLPPWSRVADYRYSAENREPHMYQSSDGATLSYEQILKNERVSRVGEGSSRSRAFVLALMIFPAVLLPVGWIIMQRRNKKQPNT